VLICRDVPERSHIGTITLGSSKMQPLVTKDKFALAALLPTKIVKQHRAAVIYNKLAVRPEVLFSHDSEEEHDIQFLE